MEEEKNLDTQYILIAGKDEKNFTDCIYFIEKSK